ncbi:MAG TPA: DEAD/DEAH box helicase family protein [Bacilli bacterium]|nr:DEAD/DEAH box helicase family protein [Bacilli bacterium]
MNEKFLRDYNDVRNFTLEDAIESKNKWFEFLLFWSKHCNYGIDNILNLYSYNKDGLLFATFDQWNNIERRIKSGSKGIPILVNNTKTFVFDISNTYGKDVFLWQNNHKFDDKILDLYTKINRAKFKDIDNLKDELYLSIKTYIGSKVDIKDNLEESERKFISSTAANLIMSKCGFNILENQYLFDFNLKDEIDINKCLKIVNEEAYKGIKEFSEIIKDFEKASLINDENEKTKFINNIYIKNGVVVDSVEDAIQVYSESYFDNDVEDNFEEIDKDVEKFTEETEEYYDDIYDYDDSLTLPNEEKSEFIDHVISEGSGFQGGKARLALIVSGNESSSEKAKLVKKEYGIGGSYGSKFNDKTYGWDSDSKGLTINVKGYKDILVKWGEVSDRIRQLLFFNTYLTDEEKKEMEALEKEKIDNSLDYQEFNDNDDEYDSEVTDLETAYDKLEELSSDDSRVVDLINTIADEMGYDDNDHEHFQRELISETNKLLEDFNMKNFKKASSQDINDTDKSLYYVEYENNHFIYYDNCPYKTMIEDLEKNHHQIIRLWKCNSITKAREELLEDNSYKNVNIEGKSLNNVNPPINYKIEDDEYYLDGGTKSRYNDNTDAINLLKDIEKENRNATFDEQQKLSKYVGWGGIPEAFDNRKENWNNEYNELKNLLSEKEYEQARESTLTSFYTPPEVIDGIYNAIQDMGFKKGNILEPSCGIGNFFGRLPKELENSKLYGVELDSISGRIAKKLYPSAKIEINAYEKSSVQDNLFDIAIGNVPFGNYQINDKRYKDKFVIHDYFFQKTLDKVRSGGLIAFITTDGTLDKKDSKVREYIAQRAEFLGAIRLPNNTFKSMANTSTTTDIIFLKKRDEVTFDIENEEWLKTGRYNDNIEINNYFINHPEMMLGKMTQRSSQFGMANTLEPYNDKTLKELINDAVKYMPHNIYENIELSEELKESKYPIMEADSTIKNGAFLIQKINNQEVLYQRNDSLLVPYKIQEGTIHKRICGLCNLKDKLREVFNIQLNDGTDDELIKAQERLSHEYDKFVNKYGFINDSANVRVFDDDPDCYLLCSIENKVLNDDNEKPVYVKGDIFSKRTIRKSKSVSRVDTADEALMLSLNERGCVDFEYMKSVYDKKEEEIINELDGIIYQDPDKINQFNKGWTIASEYLSGNVKEKLNKAIIGNDINNKIFDKNIEALEKIQPIPLSFDEISVRLGATWIPEDIYHQFTCELLDIKPYYYSSLKIKYVPEINNWLFQASGLYGWGVKNTNTWGTERADALTLIKNSLNLQSITIYDEIDESRKKVNPYETAIAREKQELIKQEFKDWLFRDEERRERITKLYNDKFNCLRLREFDGSHLKFDGMNPNINLREHQRNAVARVIYGGNTLLAHAVGAGKTYEMIASAMELKRLGIVSKPMFVVPNHLLVDWANSFLQLYPTANILVASKRDFEKNNRKKLMGKIATGDYDAVIIAHSSFGKIPMSKQYEEKHIQIQINDVVNAIERISLENGSGLSVKKLELTKKTLENKLKKLLDDSRKDDVVTFEELGVDSLFVDEAHEFKNLALFSKIRNVAGINNTDSLKASDLYMKTSYINEQNNGRGIIFATGTPVSNTMGELYTMQKYLQMNRLREMGLEHFDDWASTFGETVNSFELAPDGSGFRSKVRFAKFYNIPELLILFKEIADVKTSSMLNLPIPKLKDNKYENILAPKSNELSEYINSLVERSSLIKNRQIHPTEDNMLKVTNDGRKAALDLRLIDPTMPDIEYSKVNMAVGNIYKTWLETNENKSTQLAFCDLSTPKEVSFSVYNDIREKLIRKGIPENEIEFIHNAKSDVQKSKLYEKVRNGNVRVLLGSTQKMGAGMNVQDKLIALHHLDCPWRPSDLEQREGRMLRQGNTNEEVQIFRYITEGSFDAYSYQLIETKAGFINQIMGDNIAGERTAEDIDRSTLSYAEVKAIASGNKLVLDKFKIENELKQLYLSKSQYDKSKYELTNKLQGSLPRELNYKKEMLLNLEKDILKVEDLSADNFRIILNNKEYNSRSEASERLYLNFSNLKIGEETKLGEVSGFDIIGLKDELRYMPIIYLRGYGTYKVEINNQNEIGNIIKLENVLKSFEKRIGNVKEEIIYTEKQINDVEETLSRPFQHTERIKELQRQKVNIDSQLDLDKNDVDEELEDIDDGDVEIVEKEMEY